MQSYSHLYLSWLQQNDNNKMQFRLVLDVRTSGYINQISSLILVRKCNVFWLIFRECQAWCVAVYFWYPCSLNLEIFRWLQIWFSWDAHYQINQRLYAYTTRRGHLYKWIPYQLAFPKPLTRPFLLKYVKPLGSANQASLPLLRAPWGATHEWTAFVHPSGLPVVM